jgi:hypothetical protein
MATCVVVDVNDEWCRYAVTATGERIGFDMCFSPECARHISRCTCEDGPTPPRLGATVSVTLERPPVAPAA